MITFTVDETFIKEAYQSACDTWKVKIKDKFPDAFKSELEVGKWYKHKSSGNDYLVNYKGDGIAYGFFNGSYGFDWGFNEDRINQGAKLATEEEVKTALVKEAEKRGFKKGNETTCLTANGGVIISAPYLNGSDLSVKVDGANSGYADIFNNGKWATIIKETEVSLTDLIECYKKTNNIDNLKVI